MRSCQVGQGEPPHFVLTEGDYPVSRGLWKLTAIQLHS